MVKDESMSLKAAVPLNSRSLTRFHAKLTNLCKELNIPTKNDEAEQILSSVAKLQNHLKVEISQEQIQSAIQKMSFEISQCVTLTEKAKVSLEKFSESSKSIWDHLNSMKERIESLRINPNAALN